MNLTKEITRLQFLDKYALGKELGYTRAESRKRGKMALFGEALDKLPWPEPIVDPITLGPTTRYDEYRFAAMGDEA